MSVIVIKQNVTLEQVRAAKPKMIWYGANTCWWTHDPDDLREAGRLGKQPLPSDPRGGMLLQTEDVDGFLSQAEASPERYGKHGLAAFVAAHHRNCLIVASSEDAAVGSARPWSMSTWQAYNDAIDETQRRMEGECSVIAAGDRRTMTQDQWRAEGAALFGSDMFQWRFVCPICGNVQSPEDFRQYKDAGATPESAYKECVGRYRDRARRAFGSGDEEVSAPCDFAAYGLFRLGAVKVEGLDYPIFDFDREAAQRNSEGGTPSAEARSRSA